MYDLDINAKHIALIYDVVSGAASWADVVKMLQQEFNAGFGRIGFTTNGKNHFVVSAQDQGESDCFWCKKKHCCLIKQSEYEIMNQIIVRKYCNGLSSKKCPNNAQQTENNHSTASGYFVCKNNIGLQFLFPRQKEYRAYSIEEIYRFNVYAQHICRSIEFEGYAGKSLPEQIYGQALCNSFGLTDAESKMILEFLKSGGSMPHIAKQLNRSYHTIRNQMKAVLAKVGVSNQVELYKCLTENNISQVDEIHFANCLPSKS